MQTPEPPPTDLPPRDAVIDLLRQMNDNLHEMGWDNDHLPILGMISYSPGLLRASVFPLAFPDNVGHFLLWLGGQMIDESDPYQRKLMKGIAENDLFALYFAAEVWEHAMVANEGNLAMVRNDVRVVTAVDLLGRTYQIEHRRDQDPEIFTNDQKGEQPAGAIFEGLRLMLLGLTRVIPNGDYYRLKLWDLRIMNDEEVAERNAARKAGSPTAEPPRPEPR